MKSNSFINPNYDLFADFITTLPQHFDTFGTVIKNDRNEIRVGQVNNVKVVVKAFNKITFANRIIYRFIRKSKARRAFEYGNILNKKGINTPIPIGYNDQLSTFKLEKSFFVSFFIDHKTVPEAIENTNDTLKKIQIIKNLATFLSEVHSKHIFHGDLNLSNILIKEKNEETKFYLIDTNRMRFKRPTLKRRLNNLKFISLPITQYVVMMAEYAKPCKDPYHFVNKILSTREKQNKCTKMKKRVKRPYKLITGQL